MERPIRAPVTNLFVNFNWGSTELFHDVVADLVDELGDVNRVGATVVGREYYDYLDRQQTIEYDPLHCVQDVHRDLLEVTVDAERIEQLEAEFGTPSLWRVLIADRTYFSYDHETQRRLTQGWFDFYLDVFKRFEPDVFFTSAVDSTYTWIPFRIVEERYGTSFQHKHTRVLNKTAIIRNMYDDFEDVLGLFRRFEDDPGLTDQYADSYELARSYMEDLRTDRIKPSYSAAPSSGGGTSILTEAFSYFWEYHFGDYADDFYHDPSWRRIMVNLQRLFRTAKLRFTDFYDKTDYAEPFVYFPLHLQPEATTAVLAPMYIHQRDIIRAVSKSLPLNYKLYVKEHPKMVGKRDLAYYKELREVPNVVLVDPAVDSQEIVNEADLVVTITGTGGWESVLHRTPTIVLGKPHYRKLSMVYEAGDPDAIAETVCHAIFNHKHKERELLHYLTALLVHSVECPLHLHGAEQEQAKQEFAQVLAQQIRRHGSSKI